jgi:hypothetical protein
MDRPQDIPVKRLIKALLAISFGTIIEWYDFTICKCFRRTVLSYVRCCRSVRSTMPRAPRA